MDATVPRARLAEAVAFAARALPARPAVAHLAGIGLCAGPGTVQISASDQAVTATARPAAEVAAPGAVRVPGRLLAELTARLPEAPVRLVRDGQRLRLRCGDVRFTLATLPGPAPEPPAAPPPAGEVDTAVLAAALAQVAVAAAREETLAVLTAMAVHVRDAHLTLATTDRFRIAARTLPLRPAAGSPDLRVLVPARPLAGLARALAAPVATLGAGDGVLGIRAGDRDLLLRLVEAAGPDHLARIPTAFAGTAELPAAALEQAVRRVGLAATGSEPVRLSLSAGRLEVTAGTAERVEAGESLPVRYAGPPLSAAYTPRYLTDVLAAERVLLHVSVAGPTLITGPDGPAGPGLRYLVAPRRPAA